MSNNVSCDWEIEPRPFNIEISPRLIDCKDLEVPKQLLLNNLIEYQSKDISHRSLQASRKNLYFMDNRIHT